MSIHPQLFEALQAIPFAGSHRRRMEEIPRHFHKIGLTLEVAGDEQHLNRSRSTLTAYARRLKLTFPDYPKPRKKADG